MPAKKKRGAVRRITMLVGQGQSQCVVGMRHAYGAVRFIHRESSPIRLRLVKAPLDRVGNVRRQFGPRHGGSLEMVFEVERHVDGERRGAAAAEAQDARQQ